MKELLSNIIITTFAVIGLYQSIKLNPSASIAQSNPNNNNGTKEAVQIQPVQGGKLHKVSLTVDEPSDLKVRLGEVISAGQIIADQSQERARLELKRKEIKLAIERIKAQKITPPIKPIDPDKPNDIPVLADLSGFSDQEYQAQIHSAELKLKQIESQIIFRQRQLDYLKGLNGVETAIIEHESIKIGELQMNLELAQTDLELVNGRLQSALNKRKQEEYNHSLNVAKRLEEINQAKSFYQRQIAQNQIEYQKALSFYEKDVRERDYKLIDLELAQQNVVEKLSQLSTIRSPYAGEIKRIKFAGQRENKLAIELSIIVGNVSGNGSNSDFKTFTNFNPIAPIK